LCLGAAEIDFTALTQSVVFIKETELLLISDHWNAVINFNVPFCVTTVETIKADLLVLKEVADSTASVGVLRHVESALVSLENKLADIRRFAPRPSRKRGLINAGWFLLKSLLGTATTGDLDKLHETITDLHRTQDNVAHAVDQQVTYYRQLGDTVTTDHQALIYLSASVRKVAENTGNKFQEISSKFDLSAKLKETATDIRKLEIAGCRPFGSGMPRRS
jgi:hypothetical protein